MSCLQATFGNKGSKNDLFLVADCNRKGLSEEELERLVNGNWADSEGEDDPEDEEDINLILENNITELLDDFDSEIEMIAQLQAEEQYHETETVDNQVVTEQDNSRTTSNFEKLDVKNLKWRKRIFEAPNSEWTGELDPPPDIELTPFEYFQQHLSPELFEKISVETSNYAMQKDGIELKVCKDDIEKYVGILLHMGIVKMPSYRMFWAENTRYEKVADVLSRNRFEELKKYIHFNDNTLNKNPTDSEFDKLFKVRPLLENLRANTVRINPEEMHSVDEQIIPYKGRSSIKQYIKNKPHKWGFKVFTRAGASGIIYDFAVWEKELVPRKAWDFRRI